jgi:hypothetical protein
LKVCLSEIPGISVPEVTGSTVRSTLLEKVEDLGMEVQDLQAQVRLRKDEALTGKLIVDSSQSWEMILTPRGQR